MTRAKAIRGHDLKIGELAELAGCKPVTIRFYEKSGLMPPPPRTNGNYRQYGEKHIQRLRFIRHCRQHGLSLDEIAALLSFSDTPARDCSWINGLIQNHIAEVERQIQDLLQLKSQLGALLAKCSGDKRGACGILANLNSCDDCEFCKHAACLKKP